MTMRWLFAGLVGFAVAAMSVNMAVRGRESATQARGQSATIHFFTLVALGVNLLDNLALDDLADTANKLKRWEFMLVVEPLRVQNGAGAAVNPVAVF